MKDEKGVTLVTLSVTVAILMILATITIQATVGNNGLATRVQETKQNILIDAYEANEIINQTEVKEDANSGIIITQDITPPTISVFGVTANGNTAEVSVTVTDQESGIKSIKYSSDSGATWVNDYKDARAKKYTFTGLESGKTYTIMVQVEDNNGNKTEKSTTIAIK